MLFLLAAEILLDTSARRVGYRIDSTIGNVLEALAIYGAVLLVLGLLSLGFVKSRGETLRRILLWLRGLNWAELLLLRIPFGFFIALLAGHLYVNFKVNIAEFHPYSWDRFFAEVDRLMFFGIDPWTITHSLFSTVETTFLIDNLYLVWFFEIKAVTMAAACLPLRNRLRLAYLLAFTVTAAICGVLLAIVMPAAGPVYMEALTGDASFAPLMERLQALGGESSLRALEIQQRLWEGYTNPSVEPLGISAFPSMHVQYAALCALFVSALNRPLGWILALYTGVMLVGSVHLAWHYAIDGIAGIALAILIWSASLRVSRWWLERIEPRGVAPGQEGPLAAE